jgi:hypothetical protein
MRRLPPLDTLRVFEAAARLKSFKAAGDELNVTASAVSQRVATLEEELGTALFVRHTRRIELTREGERLAAGVRRGLPKSAAPSPVSTSATGPAFALPAFRPTSRAGWRRACIGSGQAIPTSSCMSPPTSPWPI